LQVCALAVGAESSRENAMISATESAEAAAGVNLV
jgi:hypothetical protein